MSIKIYIDSVPCQCGYYRSESVKDCPIDCKSYKRRQQELIKLHALRALDKSLDEAFEKNN